MAEQTLYVPKYHASARIDYLPLELPVEGCSPLQVDYISTSEVEDTFKFVEACAESGFNVGEDEYTQEEYAYEINHSETFRLRAKDTGKTEGVLLIRPSPDGRSMSPCCFKPLIFLSRDYQKVSCFSALVELSCRMARDLKLRYNSCLLPMFACCHDMIVALRKMRFSIVATLPWNGKVAGHGLQDGHLLCKDIEETDHECWTWEKILAHLDANIIEGEEYFSQLTLPQLSMLPFTYNLRAGVRVVLRNMRRDECAKVYELLRTAATGGNGYAIDEHPTLQMFKEWVLAHTYTVMLDDETTGETLALFTLGENTLARTKERLVCDTNILVIPGRGGKGIGREMCELYTGLCKDLGYKGSMSDAFFFNSKALAIANRIGYHKIGCVPKSAYVSGRGWSDTLIIFRELEGVKSLLELKSEQEQEEQQQEEEEEQETPRPSAKM